MDLHGEALDRVLQRLRGGGEAGEAILDSLGADPVVASVLLLYGLHPLDFETRVRRAIEKVRPALRSYGSDAELSSVNAGAVRIRVRGVDSAFTARTVKSAIEDELYAAAPDAVSLVLLGLEKFAAPDFVPLEKIGPVTRPVEPGSDAERTMTFEPPALECVRSPPALRSAQCVRRALRVVRRQPWAAEHEHLLEPANRRLVCVCQACAILFGGQSGQRFKRVPSRIRFLPDFQLTDAQWDSLLVPINMAFFFASGASGRMIAMYPSPAGATESLLPLETWDQIVAENPELRSMEADVEALLVNRLGAARGFPVNQYFLLPDRPVFQAGRPGARELAWALRRGRAVGGIRALFRDVDRACWRRCGGLIVPDLDFRVESAAPVPFAAVPLLAFRIAVTNAVRRRADLQCRAALPDPDRSDSPPLQPKKTRSACSTCSASRNAGARLSATCSGSTSPPRSPPSPEAPRSKYRCPAPSISMSRRPSIFTASKTARFRYASCSAAPYSTTAATAPPQVAPISWSKEARFRLPVETWRDMMETYYPNCAWLCLRRDVFERLYRYKVAPRAFPPGRPRSKEFCRRWKRR